MENFDEKTGRSIPDLFRKVAGEGAGGRISISTASIGRKLAGILLCGVSRPWRRKKMTRKWPSPPFSTSSKVVKERLERLWEFLDAEMSDLELDEVFAAEAEMRRKTEELEEFQSVVRKLQSYDASECERDCLRKEAAMELRRLAKDDETARETLAMLGAIPPLVEMLDSDEIEIQVASLYALLNLGIGNNANKSAIVSVGAVNKMMKMISQGSVSWCVSEAVVVNFLALSALDANKQIIGSSGAVPFLAEKFRVSDPLRAQTRLDAIRAILNLAIAPENIPLILNIELVPDLLAAIGDMSVSEKVLSVLSCVISTSEGRTSVSRTPDAFQILIDVLNWSDSPRCQEQATFILLFMARTSSSYRRKMIDAGITSPLLELAIVGTPLAQNRASLILECLKFSPDDKHQRFSDAFEGISTACGIDPAISGLEIQEPEICDEKRSINVLVHQSLLNTTKNILKRANLPPLSASSCSV